MRDGWNEEEMRLLDEFAKAALPALITLCVNDSHGSVDYAEHCANKAYDFAYAMMFERSARREIEGLTL